MSSKDWKALCAERKQRQLDAIPKEWRIHPPPDSHRNVLDVPLACGLLTPRETLITETVDVDVLLAKLRTAEWSSVEVTTAFYKRALIAHQLVRPPLLTISLSSPLFHVGLLTARSFRRRTV